MKTKKINKDKSHNSKIEQNFGTGKLCAFAYLSILNFSINRYIIGTYRQGITFGGVALFAE